MARATPPPAIESDRTTSITSHFAATDTISDYVIFPLLGLPFCLIWLLVARIVSFIAPFLIIPAYFICRPFYWAVPLARAALASQQWVRFGCVRPAN